MSEVWGASKSWTSHFNASDSSTDAPNGVNGSTTGVVFTERASASKSSPVKAVSLRPSSASSKMCRSRGVVYGELEPVPNDPSVDPDWDLCFNCWKPSHSHKECKYPKYHDYCRNCGRRGVNWTTCPRCAKGYRDYQQWRLDNNRPEYKEREKPIISRQVVETSSKDNIVHPASLVELPASKAPLESDFKIAQSEFPAMKSNSTCTASSGNGGTVAQSGSTVNNSFPTCRDLFGNEFKMAQSEFPVMKSTSTSTALFGNGGTIAQSGSTVNNAFPTCRDLFGNELKMAQSEFPVMKSIPSSTASVENEYTFGQSGFNSDSNSFSTNTYSSKNEYTAVQSGFSISDSFQSSNAAFGNERNTAHSDYPVSKFFPTSRPFRSESMTPGTEFSVVNSFSISGNQRERTNFETEVSTTRPILPPPLRNAAREMNMNIVTHSKPNTALYQHAIREIIIQNERANQSIASKQNNSNSLGESLISSEEGDYIIDEDLDGIIVDEEETDSSEPCASNTIQDFLSLIDVVKHLPIETQNKIVEQFAKERRLLAVGGEMEKLKNRFH